MVKNIYFIFLILQCSFLVPAYGQVNNSSADRNIESGFSIYRDTITVSIKGEMTHALKYRDKLYVLFEQPVLKYGGYGRRCLYIFSNGHLERVIDCPKEMEAAYLDFYEKNDSLILKPYMNKRSYKLNLKSDTWDAIVKTDDLIFEDNKFRVYSLDFGEWGGKTWFKDVNTGLEYVTELTAPLINKIDTVYYLTQPFKVLEIANPLKLNKCTDDFTYENIQSGKKYLSRYGFPKGFIIIYEDTTFNQPDYSYKPHIVSSFILKNELLHIYETSKAAYIARARNDAIDTIQKIGENISFYDWYYSYRCKNLKGNNELLKFHTKEKHLFGLMEINNNKILLHYFVNKAELNPGLIGTEKADSIFIKRLNAILPDFNNLRLSRIDLKEQTWGSFDITPNHKIGLGSGWNPNRYTLDTCKSYLIKEDSLISNSIMYYATKEKDLVRAATIDWEDETGLFNPLSEEFIKEKFERKLSVIENCISQKAGKELRREEKKSIIEITWETPSGLMIELEKMSNKNYNNIRLVIYQNK